MVAGFVDRGVGVMVLFVAHLLKRLPPTQVPDQAPQPRLVALPRCRDEPVQVHPQAGDAVRPVEARIGEQVGVAQPG